MRRQRENYFNRDRNGGPSRVFVEGVHRLRWWRRRPANKKSRSSEIFIAVPFVWLPPAHFRLIGIFVQ